MASMSSWSRRELALAMVVVSIRALTGCATPYQPNGAMGGWTERRLGADAFFVEFKGNGNTPRALVPNMLLYRCAELTAQNQYDVFTVRTPGADVGTAPTIQHMSDTDGAPELEGMRTARVSTPIYVPARTITSYDAVGELRMAHQRDLPRDVRVWDARLVMRALKDAVSGKARPLATEQVAAVATVSGQRRSAGGSPGTSLDDLSQLLPQ